MQYKRSEYDAEKHDIFKALSVKQPHANNIAKGLKRIELRNQGTKYRGDVLICSSAKPVLEDMMSGCSICLVEIYEVKRVSDLTDAEKKFCCVSDTLLAEYEFAWFLRNPRKVIEFPVKGQLGIYNLVYTEGCIIEYPELTEKLIGEDEDEKKPLKGCLYVLLFGLVFWTIVLLVALYFIFR